MRGVRIGKPESETTALDVPSQSEQPSVEIDADTVMDIHNVERDTFTAGWKKAEGIGGPENPPHHNNVFRMAIDQYVYEQNYKNGIFKKKIGSKDRMDILKVFQIFIESPETTMKEKLVFIQCLRWSLVHADNVFVPGMADVWAPVNALVGIFQADVEAQASQAKTLATDKTPPAPPKCKGIPWSEILLGIYTQGQTDSDGDYKPPPMVQIVGQDDAVRATIIFKTDGSAKLTEGGIHGLPPDAPAWYVEKLRTEKLRFRRMQMNGTWSEWDKVPEATTRGADGCPKTND